MGAEADKGEHQLVRQISQLSEYFALLPEAAGEQIVHLVEHDDPHFQIAQRPQRLRLGLEHRAGRAVHADRFEQRQIENALRDAWRHLDRDNRHRGAATLAADLGRMQPRKLPIDLRLADPGLAEDQQARHAPVARVRQDALHLVEDDRRFRVGDPAIASGVADPRLLARGRNKSSPQSVVRDDAYHE
nr:hypothetical protein [Nitrobacter hamburgensis]